MKSHRRKILAILALVVLPLLVFAGYKALPFGALKKAATPLTVKEGDILFQESESAQCTAVKKATKSRYSHCGIVLKHHGKLEVFEAIQPVCYTPLEEWIERGNSGHVVIKRLRSYPQGLDSLVLRTMHNIAEDFEGKNYDIYFGWKDDRIYCSELVWKLYQRAMKTELGQLRTLKDFDLSSPEVRQIMTSRYGNNIPYLEQVIAPSDIYDCPLLYEVERRN